MQRIKILDSHCVNQIAAGEVVERPLSVVKELVENSLDAGAKKIEITIEGGGTSLIKVRDDGIGILPEDLRLAVLPHATSKIKSIEDLERLHTLGFRGEALPSIASVSRLSILSRTADSVAGYEIRLEGGRVESLSESASSVGTIVSVADLFFNTPARQKFLKSPSTEFGAISDMVSRIALARPDVSFVLRHNNKTLLSTPGNGILVEAAGAVLGNDTARKLLTLSYDEQDSDSAFTHSGHDLSINGLISPPDLIRSSRTGLTFVINGRVIFSNGLANAVKAGYHTLIPAGSYPLSILHFHMNPANYDVNVHPAKLEIKFNDEKRITQIITETVQKTLLSNRLVRGFSVNGIKENKSDDIDFRKENRNGTNLGSGDLNESFIIAADNQKDFFVQEKALGFGTREQTIPYRNGEIFNKNNDISDTGNTRGKYLSEHPAGPSSGKYPQQKLSGTSYEHEQLRMLYLAKPNSLGLNSDQQSDKICTSVLPSSPGRESVREKDNTPVSIAGYSPFTDNSQSNESGDHSALYPENYPGNKPEDNPGNYLFYNLRALSQVFGTYILATDEQSLYIIDQHAAHERMRYEKLLELLKDNTLSSQMLLVPEVMELTLQEEQIMLDSLEALQELGFIIEHFGDRAYLLRGVPLLSDTTAPAKLFKLFFDEVLTKGQLPTKQTLLEQWVFTIACRTSIKGNEKLSVSEMEELIQSLGKTTNPYSCPHGRPILIEISRSDLEKMFYR